MRAQYRLVPQYAIVPQRLGYEYPSILMQSASQQHHANIRNAIHVGVEFIALHTLFPGITIRFALGEPFISRHTMGTSQMNVVSIWPTTSNQRIFNPSPL